MGSKKVSIVTTLYRSSKYIEEFYRRIVDAVKRVELDYQLIFVNDGSPDDSFEIACGIARKDSRVKVVDLSRNFGHHRAAMTGLGYADGDLVFLIDVDLEEEPELLVPFYEKMVQQGVDVVYGVQAKRKGGFVERFFGGMFYRVINMLSSIKIAKDVLMARLMTRRYVDSLAEHKESEFDISSLWELTGYEQVPVRVTKHANPETSYTFAKRCAAMIRGLVSATNRPLILIAVLGLIILGLSFLYFVYLMYVFATAGRPPDGFTTIILSLWFLGGLTIFCIGVLSIYLSVIFIETKNRPYAIVRQVCQYDDVAGGRTQG